MTKQQVSDIASNSINYLGTTASLIYSPANDSNTGWGGAATSTLTGAAAGASLGSGIPGIGTAAGAVVGAVGGFLTSALKKGKVTTNGFYGDPTKQNGGIFYNNDKINNRYNWALNTVQGNRAGLVASEIANYNWLKNHDTNVRTMANGGVTGSLVYGNDGELVKFPNGDIKQFAELGLPTDSQLAWLPNNSKILNKEDSENITERMKSSKNKDKYAQGTDAANKLIASILFDLAFEKLEVEKARKGIKQKTKKLIPAADGGVFVRGDRPKVVLVPNTAYKSVSRYYTYPYYNKFTPEEVSPNAAAFFGQLKPQNNTTVSGTPTTTTATQTSSDFSVVPADTHVGSTYSTTVATPVTNSSTRSSSRTSTRRSASTTNATINTPVVQPLTVKYPDRLKVSNTEIAGLPKTTQSSVPAKLTNPGKPSGGNTTVDEAEDNNNHSFNWSGVLSKAGALAPIMANMFAGTPEPVQANFNPYENVALNVMRGRRYNVKPQLDDVNRNRSIANYNMRNMNTNTGANMAYSLLSAIDTNRAIQSIRNQELNVNAQYAAEYANMSNNFGQQRVTAMNLADDYNAQNRAAADNHVMTSLGQLSNYLQYNDLMNNLRNRDFEMFPLYRQLLKAGSTDEDIAEITRNNTRHIRRKGGKRNGSKQV